MGVSGMTALVGAGLMALLIPVESLFEKRSPFSEAASLHARSVKKKNKIKMPNLLSRMIEKLKK